MGRRRFRLSEMMPNAWFYRLKASMIRPQKKHTSIPRHSPTITVPSRYPRQPVPPPINLGRASYYIPSAQHTKLHPCSQAGRLPRGDIDTSRLLLDSPRKSSKKPIRVKGSRAQQAVKPYGMRPVSDTESESSTDCLTIPVRHPEFEEYYEDDHGGLPCTDKAVVSELLSSRGTETDKTTSDVASNSGMLDSEASLEVVEVDLPPILTKPINQEVPNLDSPQGVHRRVSGIRRPQGPKRRVLVTTPRITAKPAPPQPREQQQREPKKSGSGGAKVSSGGKGRVMAGSVAVVRASADPKRDFQESMMEMITANGIRGNNELEDLLACYLSLNSREYHDVIVKVFEQVWFDFTHGSGGTRKR